MLKHRVNKYEDFGGRGGKGTLGGGGGPTGPREIIESGNIKDLIPLPENFEYLEDVDLIREDFEGSKIKCSTRKENLEEDLRNVWNVLNRKYKNQIHGEKELVYVSDSTASRSSSGDFLNSSSEKSRKCLDSSSMLPMPLSLERSPVSGTGSGSTNKCNVSWQNGNLSTNAVAEPWTSQMAEQMKKKMEDFDYKIYEEVDFKKIFPTKRKLEENENVIPVASNNSNYSRFSDSWKRGIRNVFRKKIKLRK